MPANQNIKSVLIIGAGPIVIGQACEFDYSGTQACKALKEEGCRVILVNSNPATIMTDMDMADATYIEPIEWKTIERIIAIEKPDALLTTMGGQTALNCALDLERMGVLKKHNVEMIGANREVIDKAEDRELFRASVHKIGLETPASFVAHSLEDALSAQKTIGFPVVIRPSFTMGGSGGGIAFNIEEFVDICQRGLDMSPTHELLIEESILGWKEFEMEVVRDRKDNCIIVSSVENFDPVGIHTGDSITIAPAQTLTDKEYQQMRNASFAILREIGVDTGGSNVQFAVHPENGRMVVIEMNPRVSRSSALVSKATGFPIAKVATKLALGYTLDEIQNDITGGQIPASFEPSIDYIVVKMPQFAFEKFPTADDRLTIQMKSVGEVMALGSTFQEALQKAIRSLENNRYGLESMVDIKADDARRQIKRELISAGAERIFYIGDGLRLGISIEEIYELTKIDIWFLAQIEDLIVTEKALFEQREKTLSFELLYSAKQKGFADKFISRILGIEESDVRQMRQKLGILPVFKRVDSCAGEFSTQTSYLYSTYQQFCEAEPSNRKKIVILGSGPNRIGQGIEFDYCCVHALFSLRDEGYETIIVNCNPETVSTDYDTSDRLYFEPLCLEDVLAICDRENPEGIIVHYGGQTPLKLAKELEEAGIAIMGSSSKAIDLAEDRELFGKVLDKLGLNQTKNVTARSGEEALQLAEKIGYPMVVRPSYVLGGRAMEVVYDCNHLSRYIRQTVVISDDSPVLLDSFLDHAIEVDIDLVCDGKEVFVAGVMQHIEQAGIHSGDSACSLPPYSLPQKVIDNMTQQVIAIAFELNVIGLINAQLAYQDGEIFILEVNPRASRTVPFICKAIGLPIVKIATRVMVGKSLKAQGIVRPTLNHYSVKETVFPFNKFPNVDPILGPEMCSTGEVMGVGDSFGAAFDKALLATGAPSPESGKVFISLRKLDRSHLVDLGKRLVAQGFELVATRSNQQTLNNAGLECQMVNKVSEGSPHIIDMIKNNDINFIINSTEDTQGIEDDAEIRRQALVRRVVCTTTVSAAYAILDGLKMRSQIGVRSQQQLHKLKLE